MINLNTNLGALIVQSNLKTSTNGLNRAIERMTTGFKINHAKDNAANYSISTKLSSKISGYQIAEDNVSMGLDMLMTAMDSLDLISANLSRVRDLAEQAQNGTYGEASLKAIQSEAAARIAECDRITTTTVYNDMKVFRPSYDVSGDFIAEVKVLSEDEAIKEGYTIIRTPDELQAMQDDLDGKYILMNDIDLAGYAWTAVGIDGNAFTGELNGNGFVIHNLTINSAAVSQGLFGYTTNAVLKNIGIENADVQGGTHCTGALVGICVNGGLEVDNCYSTGKVSGMKWVGGLIGYQRTAQGSPVLIRNCYSSADVSGSTCVGGLMGENEPECEITNCYATGDVSASDKAGGLIGVLNCKMYGCYATGKVERALGGGAIGGLIGYNYNQALAENCYWNIDTSGMTIGVGGTINLDKTPVVGLTSEQLATKIDKEELPSIYVPKDNFIKFQTGINSDTSSQLSLNLGFSINLAIDVLDPNSLDQIDRYLKKINEKQTEFGSAYNRLESALDTIGVSIDNLVSTQSTIQDADIAEESCAYIRNQILQQAAATLLATANQTPSIALQLL